MSMHNQHSDRQQAAQQSKRIEQTEERSIIEDLKITIETERNTLQHIADSNAEDQ